MVAGTSTPLLWDSHIPLSFSLRPLWTFELSPPSRWGERRCCEDVHKFLFEHLSSLPFFFFLSFFEEIARSVIAESWDNSMINLLGNHQLIFPPAMGEGSNFSTSWPILVLFHF